MPLPRIDAAKPGRVPYERQTLEHPNPLARFAHRRRHRLALALAARHVAAGGAALDFGAGTGAFLHALGRQRPDLRLMAFEPFMAIRFPGIVHTTTLEALADGSLAAITAFEVCEHLAPPQLDHLLAQARRLLHPGGRLLVSVPLMQGLALPVKEATRALLFRRASDYRAADLLRGTFGLAVARPPDILTSHKGFDHRGLWRRIEQPFSLVEGALSPYPALPWWMNSQHFGVFAPRRD